MMIHATETVRREGEIDIHWNRKKTKKERNQNKVVVQVGEVA